MRTFWRTCRVSAAAAAVVLAAMLSLSFAATATALPDHPDHCGNTCPGPGPNSGGGPGPPDTGNPAPDPDPDPDPDPAPDPDDLWTSECDDEGDCESVPGFLDLGPDAGPGSTPPSGPFGSGPRP